MPPKRPLAERLWEKVDVRGEDECWEWRGAHHPNGYGRINVNRRALPAHRCVWRLTQCAFLPDHLFVCHRCDNPQCCNPKHLFIGTNYDNVRDAVRKNRNSKPPTYQGEQHPSARLTVSQVLEIRQRRRTHNMSISTLANQYHVNTGTISDIVHGYTWQHLLGTGGKKNRKRGGKDVQQCARHSWPSG
jgi:hypothetical protein